MIKITHTDNSITIDGHSGYAPIGQDIVCAGVSALVQSFLSSADELTNDEIKAVISAGKAVIRYENLSAESKLLVDSLFIGLNLIAENYPDYVRVMV